MLLTSKTLKFVCVFFFSFLLLFFISFLFWKTLLAISAIVMALLVFLVFLSASSQHCCVVVGSVVLSVLPGVSAERMSYIENRGVWGSLGERAGWTPNCYCSLTSFMRSDFPDAPVPWQKVHGSCYSWGLLCSHVDGAAFTLKNSPSLYRTLIW